MSNPLQKWLRSADPAWRLKLATEAGTSVNYLYQLSGLEKNRRRPNVVMAVKLEAATRKINKVRPDLPIVTVLDLARLFE